MRLLKPSWVTHDGHPIFSLDIHPDGSRFATGGQGEDSGRVVVWNMASVANEDDEKDEKVPKMLCQMDNHLACVNCVRWSNNGKYLASGGDDKVIMIWQCSSAVGSSVMFGGGGGGKTIVEHWRCIITLRGHSGDILDLSWSPHDAWLASCSVDNTIIIWNAVKMPEILSVLRGHSGLVKGVAWDPVGKYIASQSDDKTLRVWRTLDWQQEISVSEPFAECGGTTHVLRLSWSPDGQFLVSSHAMNNSGPTAQIVERDGWKTEKDFVGHRKAITCVRFNPNILSKVNKESGKVLHYCCCAIGSRDRSLSIWLTSLKRPLVVIHDLFSNSILDIAWSQNGCQLMVCSWDGTVAYLDFSDEEIGTPLTQDEKSLFHQKMYGKSLAMTNHVNSTATVIENPELLKLKEKREKEQQNSSQQSKQDAGRVPVCARGPLNKQIETRTADGRRRITPMFIAATPDLVDTPVPFNSRMQPTFSSSTEPRSKIIIEKLDESQPAAGVTTPDGNLVNSVTSAKENEVPSTTQLNRPAELISHVPNGTTVVVPAVAVTVTTPTAAPVPEVPKTPTAPLNTSPLLYVEKQKTVTSEKELKVPDKSSEKIKETTCKIKVADPVIQVKRKLELPKDLTTKVIVKRGPGRPPLAEKIAQQVAAAAAAAEREAREASRSVHVCNASGIHLPALKSENSSFQVPLGKSEPSMLLSIENDIHLSGSLSVHKLKCSRNGSLAWEALLSARGCGVVGSRNLISVACEDSTLSVFSACGRRIVPSLVLSSSAAKLACSTFYVMVITSRGHISVWDFRHHKHLVKNESLSPIMSVGDASIVNASLTEHGSPLVILSTGRSYAFSSNLGTWLLIHNPEDPNAQSADHQVYDKAISSLPGFALLPLASLQSQIKKPLQQAQRLFRNNPALQQASNLSHIDYQLVASLALHSSQEYSFWLQTLVRYLVQEGLETRLRELCDSLLGPVSSSSNRPCTASGNAIINSWESHILGMHKHDLLYEILPILGSNLCLQRLYTEYQEQLESRKP